ncbi:hypothetical protein [Actinomadura kijaniata]|uniref:hypothetical protein n=1 Tax=Actinomadura kijaniata TaxID=46161 RepID=UPI000A04903B|nr:hypothetical protein [Actinomadura kijaniata]
MITSSFLRRAGRGAAAAALAGAFVLTGPGLAGSGRAAGSAAGSAADSKVLFTVSDPRINEASGIGVSRRHQGVIYTHNDSGGVPKIYALGPDGTTRAVFTLAGAAARDWEGMAMGRDEQGRPAIYVGDIGDNLGGAWPYVTVYRIPEPSELRSQTIRATAFRMKYEDGPRNAETLMINPRTNRLYVASKLFGAALYEAPARLRTGGYNRMRKVGDAPPIATDGAFSPDGRTAVIRTYFGARLYGVDAGGRPAKDLGSVGLPAQEQGESITYAADGRSLLAGSEGVRQPVHQVPLPREALPAPSATPNRLAGKDRKLDDGRRDDPGGVRVGLFLAVGITAVVGYGLLRRRA